MFYFEDQYHNTFIDTIIEKTDTGDLVKSRLAVRSR